MSRRAPAQALPPCHSSPLQGGAGQAAGATTARLWGAAGTLSVSISGRAEGRAVLPAAAGRQQLPDNKSVEQQILEHFSNQNWKVTNSARPQISACKGTGSPGASSPQPFFHPSPATPSASTDHRRCFPSPFTFLLQDSLKHQEEMLGSSRGRWRRLRL